MEELINNKNKLQRKTKTPSQPKTSKNYSLRSFDWPFSISPWENNKEDERNQRKDQFTNKKARQWMLLLILSSESANTFHEIACSYETCLPIVDTHIPDGKQANPCNK